MAIPTPVFRLDSAEKYLPMQAESVEHTGATLITPDGKQTSTPVKLASLPAAGGRMNFPNDPGRQEKELRQKGFSNKGYHRRLKGGGLDWDQYWLWYIYNPKVYVFEQGKHEGDWEFVQIGSVADTPVCMSYSQHKGGASRMWWDVEKAGGRPVVYVARDSHANFFGTLDMPPEVGDEADGKGPELDAIEWLEFDDAWSTWPGRWGNSTGTGHSPQSPGSQGNRWKAPHRFHSGATARA